MKPKVICTLENYSTKFFMARTNINEIKKQPGITEVHGKVQEIKLEKLSIKLIPLFHPAAIIYNRKLKPLWIKDIKIVKKHCKS